MADIPFWKHDDADLTSEIPHDQADDDSPITIGEHTFHWQEGIAADVHLQDDDGNEVGRVFIPYDPDNQPSEADLARGSQSVFPRHGLCGPS